MLGEKLRILVVDDEERNVHLIEAMLAPFDYEVITAGNGQEAVDMVRQTPPDVILMDVMMPVMDGLEAAKRLKENDRTKVIPIIMITALKSMEDRVKALEAGADDFLTKPVDRTELTARVRNSLKVKEYFDMIDLQNRQLLEAYEIIKREQEKSDELLLNVLPKKIAYELKYTGKTRPESFQNITVMFSDIFGDTVNVASRMEQYSEPMKINVSRMTYEIVRDNFPFINELVSNSINRYSPHTMNNPGSCRVFPTAF